MFKYHIKNKKCRSLYHETTFCDEHFDIAHKTGHSTTIEAAKIAKIAKAKKLIIGHYSKRYSDLNELLNESRSVFENSFLSREGDVLDFDTI